MNKNDMAHAVAELSDAIYLIRGVIQGLKQDEMSGIRVSDRLEDAVRRLSGLSKNNLIDPHIIVNASRREVLNIAHGQHIAAVDLEIIIKKLTAIKDCFDDCPKE